MRSDPRGVDAWRLGVAIQTLALVLYASPDGVGGRPLVMIGLAMIAILTVRMIVSRPRPAGWLLGWASIGATFTLYAVASTLWSLSPRVSLEDGVTTGLMLAFVGLTAATRWSDRSTLRADLAFIFGLTVLLQVTGLLAGMAGLPTIYDPDYGRFRGWFSNANYAGMFSAFGLAVGLGTLLVRDGESAQHPGSSARIGPTEHEAGRGRNVAWWVTLAGCVVLWISLTLAQSRGAMLALALALLVLVLPRLSWRRALGAVLLTWLIGTTTVVLNAMTNPPPGSSGQVSKVGWFLFDPFTRDSTTDLSSGRVEIYQKLVSTVQAHPLLGTGYRTTELSERFDGIAGHNIYLSTAAELGIVGGFLILSLMVLPAWRGLSGYRLRTGAAAATGAAVVGLSELFESSILGWGSPTTLFAWLIAVGGACTVRRQPVGGSG